MGPSAMRAAGLAARLRGLGHEVVDDGDFAVGIPERKPVGDEQARYANEIAKICERVADRVEKRLDEGWTPLVLGGDHSAAMGAIAGSARGEMRPGHGLGLIWFDAHADINTPQSSPSGNVHGMPLAYCFGLADGPPARLFRAGPILDPSRCVLMGTRSVDPGERTHLQDLGLRVLTMRAIDEDGMKRSIEKAIAWASDGGQALHVSLDMDVLDPTEAPGVGTPCRGGATYREAHLAMEILADSGLVRSMDVAEVNPILDSKNRTAELAVELVLSAFGLHIA